MSELRIRINGFFQSLRWTVFLLGGIMAASLSNDLQGQEVLQETTPSDTTVTIILDEPADKVKLFTKDNVQYQILQGNVRLRHDSTFMRMDSAVVDDNNQLEAYGNVVIQELDSTYVFSDTLFYNGNTRMAELIGEVVLEKGDQRLFSDYLIYDLGERIARFDKKSYMTDEEKQLSSLRGVFHVNEDKILFYDSVLVISDTFNLKADSMAFFTEEYRVQFLGPTILYNDSSRIYTEKGYYLMNEEEALFRQNAQFSSGESKGKADSIYYYGNRGVYVLLGNAFLEKEDQTAVANMIEYHEREDLLYLYGEAIVDGEDVHAVGDTLIYDNRTNSVRARGRSTIQRVDFTLSSDHVDYSDSLKVGYASGDVIWEDSSGMKRIYTDTLQFQSEGQSAKAMGIFRRPMFDWENEEGDILHLISDTLITFQSVISRKDTAGLELADTTQDFIAYYDVAVIRDDMQGRADSLAYMESDSMIVMYGNPILWMDTTQLSGDTIFVNMIEGEINNVLIRGNAFILTSPDSIFFNQIKGRQIMAFFEDGKLVRTDVEGNAESIYFPLDDENGYIGMNKIICSKIEMYFENNNVTGIAFLEQPSGELISMKEVSDENSVLKGYRNQDRLRPGSIEHEREFRNARWSKRKIRNYNEE